MTPGGAQLLGEGMLNWSRGERIGDRYGCVVLFQDVPGWSASMEDYLDGGGYPAALDWLAEPVGECGRLVAEVVSTRQSAHIGDIVRGLYPPQEDADRAAVGSRHVLGEGEVFTERDDEGTTYLGVRPDDGRAHDWLDPELLYLLHEQTVRLYFEPLGQR
jgi:hypothetical protein